MPTHGEFVAEMARQVVFEAYGEDAYTRGLTVYTTIRKADQEAAYAALRRGVLDYDRRHGYRGPESLVNLPETPAELEAALEKAFQEAVDSDGLLPAVVLAASPTEVEAVLSDGESVKVTGDGLRFVARALGDKAAPATRLRRGALIRLARDDKSRWTITQLPTAEAAFVSMRPRDGAIVSLVGGFDFERNKFNHVTQAQRQPGSSFKPFIYSAALEKGFTPGTVVNDAPLFFDAAETGSQPWEPKNYDGKFEGPMLLRTALARSKNMVSIRLLDAIGPQYAQDYVTRFGFDADRHPPFLTMALGAGAVTPWQMARAITVFANGGYRIEPYVLAGDICAGDGYDGRGGWSWYTGSAAWLYRLGLERILGIRRHGVDLVVDPCIPAAWPRFEVTWRRGRTVHRVRVENPSGVSRGISTITLDGHPVAGPRIPFPDDGAAHEIVVVLGQPESAV